MSTADFTDNTDVISTHTPRVVFIREIRVIRGFNRTGKQKSLREYYDRPAILGADDRGGAMALLFATEMALSQ